MTDKPDGKSRPVERIIEGLKQYNEWRRGADFEQPAPADIGRNIDAAIAILQQRKGRLVEQNAWNEIEATARSCQKTWGMGFPIISITLLKKILNKE